MDPNQSSKTMQSKFKVSIFTTSNVLSCIEFCFCTIQTNAIENEQQNVDSTIDMMKASANLVEHFKLDNGSNYCKKCEETIIEKLELALFRAAVFFNASQRKAVEAAPRQQMLK